MTQIRVTLTDREVAFAPEAEQVDEDLAIALSCIDGTTMSAATKSSEAPAEAGPLSPLGE
jgi:hypothetical protein